MIIIDELLRTRERDGKPIRVAMVGAGFMGRGIAHQLVRSVPGMRLVAISNRNTKAAEAAYVDAGIEHPKRVSSASELDQNIESGYRSITEDALILCDSERVDVVLEVTGAVEFGAVVALRAFETGKHVVAMNAELDGTVGPILKTYADRAGVVFTNSDGDQPGVTMNLFRYVSGIGVNPVLCGNIKGLHDPYRNPTTQEGFAKKWGQKPHMVTSFADGSKISFEQAIVGNATGMVVARTGMLGPTVEPGTHVTGAGEWYPHDQLLEGPGIVDYVVGASPGPGVFVLGTCDDRVHRHYLDLYKLGKGPFYTFYTPYHLCHFEVHNSIARAALLHDATIAPRGGPVVEVVTAAKTNLQKGDVLDGIGYYKTYGLCENTSDARRQNLLPQGLALGCRLKHDVSRDQLLRFDDVELPSGRISDRLWFEQRDLFAQT